jgi:hypothetical protein
MIVLVYLVCLQLLTNSRILGTCQSVAISSNYVHMKNLELENKELHDHRK